MNGNPLHAFSDALTAAGLHPASIVADGALHRCHAKGDRQGKQSGWYVLHLNGMAAGAFGDWRTGMQEAWQHATGATLDPLTRQRMAKAVQDAKAQRERERMRNREAAQRVAAERWQRASTEAQAHPYLKRKGIGAHGVRLLGAHLLVPMRDSAGTLWAVQSISAEGEKRFLRGARKRGLYHAIGPQVDGVLCIAEGYATAASILDATGYPVAVAFDCGNLLPVARTLRGKFPEVRLIICADNDTETQARTGRNPGIEAATEAAQAVSGVVASPTDFSPCGEDMPNHARTTETANRN